MGKIIFLAFVFSLMACLNSRQSSDSVREMEFNTQGHRGCRGLMPENTISAMLKAIDLGVTTLETDAVITKDKKVILSHEPFFNHEIATKPDGSYVTGAEEKLLNIYRMNYEDIKKFDIGLKPHPRFPQQQKLKAYKPLLAEMIDSVEAYYKKNNRPRPQYNIETKSLPLTDNVYHPAPAEFVELLVEVIRSKQIEDRVIIQSFDFRTLQYLHKKYPKIKTAILIEDYDKRSLDEQLKALGFMPTIYSPEYSLVNQPLIKACHELDIKIIPWTVNTKEEIERLRSLGVDGIISDYPNLFQTEL
jgi:glycerophosphoryl diester phosphodiesterase